ncbi:MAG TPA: glycosyltransferase family 4 protein [Acidobacteriaceae bacterium]|jgi:glycosyltransferase involved in cell wall biosynthesis|nr:glycosyltransferase family 4 protein [Acidobacteriaceae bacterium]
MRIFVNEFCGHAFQIELSRELARRGHQVLHVYFADNHSTPKGPTAATTPGLAIEGLHIARAFAKHSLLTRRQADLDYGRAVAERLDRFRPEVVISANMPLDAQNLLQKAARAHNARFVFWLQDVYSVAARFVLQKKARLLASLGGLYFERLEKRLLQRSDAVVCIAPGFADFVKRWGVPQEKIAVIPNWAPLDEVVPLPRDNAWAREQRVANKFCFMYSGTLGMKHRPELLLALAKRLEATGNARLIVIAAGAGANWLAAKRHEVRSEVLTLLPFQPYERIAEVFASADVLIALLDSEAGAFAVPSKTLAYLCAGRALIVAASAENEAARVVDRADAGFVVSPDDPAGLLAAAELLLADPALGARYGANGRAYAAAHFSIQRIADRFLTVLGQAASPVAAVPVEEPAAKLTSGEAARW